MATTPFNLFDFSNLNPISKIGQPPTQVPGATGGGVLPPTKVSKPLPAQQNPVKKVQPINKPIIPIANASQGLDTKKIQSLIARAKEQGFSTKEIDNIIKAESRKGTFNLPKESPRNNQVAPQQGSKSLMEGIFANDTLRQGIKNTGEFIKNAAGGAISEAPKVLGNIAGVLATNPIDYISSGGKTSDAGQFIQKSGRRGKEYLQNKIPYDKNSISAKVGEIGTDVLATLYGPGKVFATAKEANLGIKALSSLANTSVDGTVGAVENYIATEGRLPTAKEVGDFVKTGAVLNTIGTTFNKIGGGIAARTVPTTITQAGKDFNRGLNIGRAIQDTGISLNKKSLVTKVGNKVTNISNDIDSAIQGAINKKGNNIININDITKGLKEDILNDPILRKKLQGTPIDKKDIGDAIDETLGAYNKLYKGQKLDLNKQQGIKKEIYEGLSSTFNKSDTAKLTARQVTEKAIASKLKINLEKNVPGIAELNSQLAPYLEAGKRLKEKGAYSGYLTDIIAGGFASGNPGQITQDPIGYMKNFITGVIVKRLGTSTAAKTTASSIFKNIDKLFQNKVFVRTLQNQSKNL